MSVKDQMSFPLESHRLCHWVLATPLVLLPFQFEGSTPWFSSIVAGFFFIGLAALLWLDPTLFRGGLKGKWVWPVICLLIFPFLQALPIPVSWIEVLSPHRAEWLHSAENVLGAPFSVASISYDPLRTAMGGFFWLFLAAYAWLFQLLVRDERRLDWLWKLFFAFMGLEALYGLLQVIIPDLGVQWSPVYSDYHRGSARGTFTYKNNYAGLLGMVWPVLLAHTLSLGELARDERGMTSKDEFIRKKSRLRVFQRQIFLSSILGLIFLALVFSQSRAGFLCAVIAMAVFWNIGKFHREGILRLFAVIMVVILSFGWIVGVGSILKRYEVIDISAYGRLDLWRDTMPIVRDHPLTGTGLNLYNKAIMAYHHNTSIDILEERLKDWRHAHNDYLELLADLGIPLATGIFILIWGYWWWAAKRVWIWETKDKSSKLMDRRTGTNETSEQDKWNDIRRLLALGALAGSAAFLCHSWVDWNWQSPANQVYFVVLLVLMRI